jgi:hypothetical protein
VLKLLVPEGMQKEEHEKVVRKRLQAYFTGRYHQHVDELKAIRLRAMYFIFAGIGVMLISSYIAFLKLTGFHINMLLVLFEPAGWFLFWTGLEGIVSASQAKRKESEFFLRMSLMHVEFNSYKQSQSS